MTSDGRQSLSAEWRTWLVLIATVAVGRWLAGGGFGYTLFAVVWGSIAGLHVLKSDSRWQSALSLGGVTTLFAVPWLLTWPTGIAVRLGGWLVLFIGTGHALYACGRVVGLHPVFARALATSVWLGFVVAPLLMARPVRQALGDGGLAWLLTANPLLLANAADMAAGDWTHQNVAYQHLTRLGQDIPMSWPNRAWSVGIYGTLTALGLAVPRGTIRLA